MQTCFPAAAYSDLQYFYNAPSDSQAVRMDEVDHHGSSYIAEGHHFYRYANGLMVFDSLYAPQESKIEVNRRSDLGNGLYRLENHLTQATSVFFRRKPLTPDNGPEHVAYDRHH